MENNYLISVIINSHNGEKFIEDSINSVLSQSYQNFEIIFFDNASTDQTKEKVENFSNVNKKVKYYKIDKKVKLYKARNLAIEKSSGELISFLDVDDFWFKDKLRFQHELFKSNPKLGICYSNYIIYNVIKNKKKIVLKKFPQGFVFNDLIKNNFINMSTLMVKRDSFSYLEYIFNENYEIIGDYDLTLRLSRHVLTQGINQPLSIYMWHGENLSTKKRLNIIELLNWYNKNKKNKILEEKKNLNFMKNYILYLIIRYYIKQDKKRTALINLCKIDNFRLFCLSFIFIICPNFIFKKITN